MNRVLLSLFLALATVLFSAKVTYSQDGPVSAQTEAVKAEVTTRLNKKEERVKVKLRNGSQVKGRITQTSENGFTLTVEKTNSRADIAYADVLDLEGRGMSKTKKVLIISGVAVVVFAALTAYALTHYWD